MSGDVHVQFCERPGVRFPRATHLAVLGRTPAAEMLTAVEGLMKRLKLLVNVEKTRCCRLPEESMTFLGYRIGRNHRRPRSSWSTSAALAQHRCATRDHPRNEDKKSPS